MKKSASPAVLGQNRKARFQYSIEESYECGLVLRGSEVKSLRARQFSFSDSFAEVVKEEIFLKNLHISPYGFENKSYSPPPLRSRKLLLNKREILKIQKRTRERGYTLVPLRLYLKQGRIKLELGLGRGKKLYDKRESLKQKDLKRDLARRSKNAY